MLSPAVDVEPVSTAQARAAWGTGVAPLLEAFPDHAGDILRAIAFAHRAPFPVPVFITGRPGAGKTTLARAIGELTGRGRGHGPHSRTTSGSVQDTRSNVGRDSHTLDRSHIR